MKKVRLAFADFPGESFLRNRFLDMLRTRFDVEVTTDSPDYVIYSVFGYEYLNYQNAVRIFFTWENVRPDFNLCDYAFSFDWLEFGDRHFRAPHMLLFEQYGDICARRRSTLTPEELGQRTRFCNFIYSNGRSHPVRDAFFHALCRYKNVESLGRHLNNVSRPLGTAYKGDWPGEKVALQRQYKFSIAFENSTSPGYTTEKLMHALAADTIPLYWGDPEIGRVFNTKRFVRVDENAIEKAVEQVRRLDQDDDAYMAMVSEPFFIGEVPPPQLTATAFLDRFEYIFSQPKERTFRRNFHFWGEIYEQRRRSEIVIARYLAQPRRSARKLKRLCTRMFPGRA
jgi:hypothetical protein